MTKVHSPEGFYAYAREYKVAAKTLIEQQKPGLIVPIAYLLTHALELALKSFLMFRGIDATALAKKPYRHDVSFCLKAAEERGLLNSKGATLTEEQRKQIAIASELFGNRELNYLYEKCSVLPAVDGLLSGLETVISAVFDGASAPYFRKCVPM